MNFYSVCVYVYVRTACRCVLPKIRANVPLRMCVCYLMCLEGQCP